MVRKKIFVMLMASCLLVVPFKTWAGPAQEIEVKQTAAKMKDTVGSNYVGTRYSTVETGIYDMPDESSKLLDTSRVNTSFEVITEKDGWSMISTDGGYAFIKTEFLTDREIPEYTYTDEDLYVMAHVLAGESQNCPDEEQLYVGSVVLNRVAHPAFPGNIKDVVFQKGQYACTWDGNYYREPTDRNWANAKKLLEQGSVLPSNVIWQSSGKQGSGIYIKTKWHYYCY